MGELLPEAQLIASELATNAVRYAPGSITIDVRRDERGLTIGVEDSVPAGKTDILEQTAGAEAESGRGLAIVAALANSWGVTETAEGKQVWARIGHLDMRHPPSST